MLIYLAGPIDDVTRDESMGWRESITRTLNENGYSVYNPNTAFSVILGTSEVKEICRAVDMVNKMAIRQSHLVLVNLLGSGKAIGTCREIEFAKRHGIPVIVVLDSIHTHLSLYDCELVKDMQAAIGRIPSIVNFIKKGEPYVNIPTAANSGLY